MTIKQPLKILLCCHLPLRASLGGAKVYLEAAACYRMKGHQADVIGIDQIVGENAPYMDENWRVANFPDKLRDYILNHADQYDVVEFESIYLPFDLKKKGTPLLVARSVLLDLHFREISVPRFKGWRALAGLLLKTKARRDRLDNKINQSLKTMLYADFVNVPNPDDRKILVQYGVAAEKIIVQPYGLFQDRLNQLQKPSEENRTNVKIAFVGTFDNRKGAVEFPEIVRDLLKVNENVQFKFLGVSGMFPDGESIKRHLNADKKKNDRIQIIEKYKPEELPELLKDCSIGLFPSHLESFGFGVLEMMAAGLPVAGYDSPGINMLILKELQAPRGEAAALVGIAKKLLTDSSFYAACKEKAEKVVQQFVYENQTNHSLEAYLLKREKK